MVLLAEELVEKWFNRNGFFTIRGIKLDIHEIDLLAIGLRDGTITCRHIEVQASIRPVSYICALPKKIRKATGRGPNNAKERGATEISEGVAERVEKQVLLPNKSHLRRELLPVAWKYELVVH